jgi:hypothetical protein
MNELPKYYTKKKRSDTTCHRVCDSICMKGSEEIGLQRQNTDWHCQELRGEKREEELLQR